MISKVNGVIGTSGPVLAWLRSMAPGGFPSLLLENGVDYAHFSKPQPCPPEYQTLHRPRAVYVGAIDERFDCAAVEGLAAARPEMSIVLVGPVSTPLPAGWARLKNIIQAGVRDYHAIPAYLQHADVALLPLNGHAANRRSPMKLYEYASAGLPIVSAATEEVTRRGEPFVFPYTAPDGIHEAMSAALSSTAAGEQARAAAQGRDWRRLAGELLKFCENGEKLEWP